MTVVCAGVAPSPWEPYEHVCKMGRGHAAYTAGKTEQDDILERLSQCLTHNAH